MYVPRLIKRGFICGINGQVINNHFRREKSFIDKSLHSRYYIFCVASLYLLFSGHVYIEPSMVHLRSDFPSDCPVSLLFLYCSFVFVFYIYTAGILGLFQTTQHQQSKQDKEIIFIYRRVPVILLRKRNDRSCTR